MARKIKTVDDYRSAQELRFDMKIRGALKDKIVDLIEHTEEEPTYLLREMARYYFKNNPNPHRW
jgi:hypothetical protein